MSHAAPASDGAQDRSPTQAVVFDLDGTLVDSAADIAHALNVALHDAGLAAAELSRVRAWIGDGPDRLIQRALQALGVAPDGGLHARLRAGFDRATLAAPLAQGRVYEGVDTLLRALQPRWPLAVVTNKPTPLARAVLEAARLAPYFAAVQGADEPDWRKPAPVLLHQAARALDVAAGALLMVGDSAADVRAAQAAGARSVLARWGYGHAHALDLAPHWCIDHPAELLDRLDKARGPRSMPRS